MVGEIAEFAAGLTATRPGSSTAARFSRSATSPCAASCSTNPSYWRSR
nr:hypothetical protein [Mycobacterium malmoense]